jgi:hypothetical protein
MPDHPPLPGAADRVVQCVGAEVVTVLGRLGHLVDVMDSGGLHGAGGTRAATKCCSRSAMIRGALLLGAVAACLLVSPRLWRPLAGSGAAPRPDGGRMAAAHPTGQLTAGAPVPRAAGRLPELPVDRSPRG